MEDFGFGCGVCRALHFVSLGWRVRETPAPFLQGQSLNYTFGRAKARGGGIFSLSRHLFVSLSLLMDTKPETYGIGCNFSKPC